jgi:chorismate synthase
VGRAEARLHADLAAAARFGGFADLRGGGAFSGCLTVGPKVRPGTIHVVVHPPIDTRGWTRESLHAEAERLHADFARWLAAGPSA